LTSLYHQAFMGVKMNCQFQVKRCVLILLLFTTPVFSVIPDSPFDRGVEYYQNGNNEEAIREFNRALALNPNHDEALFYRGAAYYRSGNLDQAIEDWNRVKTLNPLVAVDNYLANAYRERGILREQSSIDNAIGDYTQAIKLNQKLHIAYFNRGNAYFAKHDPNSAIPDYSMVINIDPSYFRAYNGRGLCYLDKGEVDRAIADFTQAIRLSPEYDKAYNNRGLCYLDKGEADRAIMDFTQAIRLNPKYDKAYNNRGLAYWEKRELDNALSDFNKAISINPEESRYYLNRANIYLNRRDFDRALGDLNHVIGSNRYLAEAYTIRGMLYVANDELDRGIDDYTKAIQINPNIAQSYGNRGDAYKKKGDYDKALADYDAALRLDPSLHRIYLARIEIYSDRGDIEKVVADFETMLDIASANVDFNRLFESSWHYVNRLYLGTPYLEGRMVSGAADTKILDLTKRHLVQSIEKAEQIRAGLGKRGADIMTQVLYLYYAGVDLEAQYGSAEKAFEYSESLRSRGFLEQMGTEMALRLDGVTSQERDAVKTLIDRIEAHQEILDSYKGIYIDTERDAGKFADAGIRLNEAEKDLSMLDEKIGKRIPQYAALRNFSPVDITRARAFCGSDRVVLEYVLWDKSIDYKLSPRPTINSYCLVLTKDGVRPVVLDHEFDYLKAVNELREAVINDPDKSRGLTVENSSGHKLEEQRNALYAKLVKPVLPYIPRSIKNIVIVPDGNLSNLPFDILRENSRSPDFGQSYALSFSPSVSVSIMAAKTGTRGLEPLLAFGGALYNGNNSGQDRGLVVLDENTTPDRSVAGNSAASPAEWYRMELAKFKKNYWPNLAGTETEVRRLGGLSFQRNKPVVFTGKDTTEGRIKKLSADGTLKNYPLIHFALHGYFCEEIPAYSSIVFSETGGMIPLNGEDGYLTLPEIAVLNLNARMVILSACQTGQVNLKRGDGMIGIARSFLVAGAENLGVSLWSISDEATVEFMTRLYRKVIEQKMNFRDAYGAVKNEFRRDPKWSHPFYWAAFTMYE
jgi:tetratricopeptide (TPR) repeat protein